MTRPDATCERCHRPMFNVGHPTHPRCGSEPDAHVYGVSFPNEAGKNAAISAVTTARPDLVARGVEIIRHAAEQHPFVSANLTRDAMNAAGILGPRVGAVFSAAAKQGLVRRDGFIPSDLKNTNAHHVARWCSLIYKGRAA
jgi:hypothetical protein